MKTAIVTGVSSSIGRHIAAHLNDLGWQVVGLYHSTSPSIQIEAAVKVDLSDLRATADAAKILTRDYPHIGAFIHVAGIWHDEQDVLADKRLDQFASDQITATMNVGVTSAMVLCNALLPAMHNGTVIGISGTFPTGKGWLPYYTSKRSLEDFLVGLSQDYPNVNVYGISPADTLTEAYKKFFPEYANEAQSPDAISTIISELLSGNADYPSGEIIEVRDGKNRKGFHV